MSSLFGSVDFLAHNMGHVSMRSANSIRKIATAGDPVKSASVHNKGSSGVFFMANMLNRSASKRSSINAFQNAMTFLQSQADGLRQAEKIYDRMLSLASLSADPMISDQDRMFLSEEFEALRQQSLTLAKSDLNGVSLFDEAAASTRYEITFGSQLSDQSGIAVEEKDVLYSSGTIEIDVNGGTAGGTYSLWQGTQKLFDSGNWRTRGSARTYDYDRFIIEFGPNKPTTFQFKPLSAGTSTQVQIQTPPGYPDNLVDDGNFDNKSYYLGQLGLSDDGSASGWESREGEKYSTLGQVTTQDSNSNLTTLRLEVSSTSLFQVSGRYIPPEAESAVVGNAQDLQVGLNPVGLGLLRENDDANGFPTISIATRADAQKALDSMMLEIQGLGEQFGKVGSSMNRVETSMDAAQDQVLSHEKALSNMMDEDYAKDLLELSKTRISRSQNAALLTQAMNLHQDIVNILI